MKSKKYIIASLVVVIIVALVLILKPKPFNEKLETIMSDINAYELKGDMEISKGEDVKGYVLQVDYKKENKDEFFKVSIKDKEVNQTQEILRNKEGVFVITPTLNQIFKFEGDWPLNSLKPYLIQSMAVIMKNKDATTTKKNNLYYVNSDVKYPNNANFRKQEMVFDEDGIIKQLQIKDDNNVVQLQIKFNKANYDAKLKTSYFDLPSKLEESKVSANLARNADLPLYPMNSFKSSLESKSNLEVNGTTRHVLEYRGDKNFTLIESAKTKSESLQTVIVSGQFVDSIDAFGFFDGNHMVMLRDGVEYTLYSDELTPNEMIEVLNSMQVVVMK